MCVFKLKNQCAAALVLPGRLYY